MELSGEMTNNGLGTAQFLNAFSFAPNADPNVFGSLLTASVFGQGGANDVDFYAFSAQAGTAYFDIDGGGFDSYLALFDANGTLLADNDDSFPADPGSASNTDAFLGTYSIGSAGIYYIAVSRSGNFANATFTGASFFELTRPDGAFGGFGFNGADFGDSSFLLNGAQPGDGGAYTLHVSIVPAPGALAVLVAAACCSRRRRASASLIAA